MIELPGPPGSRSLEERSTPRDGTSSPARTVIWIASYPKSGNTWVRFLACNLVFGPQDSAEALNRLAPDIHELASALAPPAAPMFIKTHFPCSPELPLAAHTAAALYVVRDPVDVMAPKDFQSRLALAQILVAANKSDQAEALLEQLGKENPASVPVQESLFRAQAALKHNDEARATAQNIEHVAPKQGLGYYLEGLIDEADKKSGAAETDYEQALQREPDSPEPLTALTRLDLQRKQPAAAMARIDAVIASSPSNAMAHNLKAEVLMTQGQTDAAIAAYQDTVRVAPTWARGYDGLALAQLRAGHNDDAIRTLQLGVDKTQDDSAVLTDLSGLYERLGRPDDAIALYQGVLDKNPHSSFAANNLAMLLVTYKHDPASLARAQKLADQLQALSVATVIDTRGWVKFKSGDFHAAESLLQQAVDKSPDAPELRYHLGMAQLRSGEPQAAQQNLESALHSAQSFAGIGDARAALARLQKSAPAG